MAEATGLVLGKWWHRTEEADRIVCDLCPRECHLKPGDRGFCFVRQNVDGKMALTTYGKSTGFCIDPIEKKPLNHFYPGTPVLSFGTAGCNLGCQFCQNWDISKSREVERLSELAMPDMIAAAARQTKCRSVAFTYNDPVIWAEYAIDTAKACRAIGIKSVAVTAGYISPPAREEFFHAMDAANVDLKAFTEDFYHRITYSHLQPVLDTLAWLKHESDVWFEITNLIIPDANDRPDEIRQMSDWILQTVGPDIPIHFSAFHPDFRMTDRGRTPHETLLLAKEIAESTGLNFVYVGNVNDAKSQSTWCPNCRALLIERNWYQLGAYGIKGNRCASCDLLIPGHFDDVPGTWGQKREPIRINSFTSHQKESVEMASEVPLVDLNVPVEPQVTKEQEFSIHRAACELILSAVLQRTCRLQDPTLAGAADVTVMGVFVTLKRNGQLRGCIGSLGRPMSLISALTQSATRTATDDHRFPPVTQSELAHLTVDVTLLFNFETVEQVGRDRIDAVRVGTHGLRIQWGSQAGLLLPGVPVEQGWDSETFLNQVCRKAGLPLSAWQQSDTHLQRFEGRMFEGQFDQTLLTDLQLDEQVPVSQRQVQALAAYVRATVMALFHGAVPGCAMPAGCSDSTVDGIALQLTFENSDATATVSRIQLRGGMAMQSTLLQLCEAAAKWLKQLNTTSQLLSRLKINLAIFSNPALHGTIQAPDLTGLDSRKRALMVSNGHRNAWHFDPACTTAELVERAAKSANIELTVSTTVISFAIRCSCERMFNSNVPQAQRGPKIRLPAVAGTFYPALAVDLERAIDDCFAGVHGTEQRKADTEVKKAWSAAMLPHAGLKFSGRIAAGTLRRIRIPDTVVIIGPKHTANGVDLAIAPNEVWQLPNTSVQSDMSLVQALAEHIEGLQLDAAAHAREHSIEMELPLLAKLAPKVGVAAIAVGGLGFDQCMQVGRQLASVISQQATQPLLVISSDMNHFASDDENRRLDEIALAAMETLDPLALYQSVQSNGISMCGVLPAVIVMEALRCLNQLKRIERTGYATSADVTGDKSRVVGYAGVLLGDLRPADKASQAG